MRILNQQLFRFGKRFLPLLFLRNAGQTTMIQDINPATRMKIRVNTFDRQAIYEVWKMKEYQNRHFTIGRGEVIVDIGAHIGAFSVWAAQQADAGQVLAFEPNPGNYALLVENGRLNQLTNLRTFNSAVSMGRGQAKLYSSDHHNMTHSFFEEAGGAYDLVPTLSLGDILEEHRLKTVDYLKIDAEGAEYDIILHAPAEVLRRVDKIFIEYHDYLDHGHSHKELRGRLAASGFEIEIGASAFHRHILKLGLIMAHRPRP